MTQYVIANIKKNFVFGEQRTPGRDSFDVACYPDSAAYIIDIRERALNILKHPNVSEFFSEDDIYDVDKLPVDIASIVLPGIPIDENRDGVWW